MENKGSSEGLQVLQLLEMMPSLWTVVIMGNVRVSSIPINPQHMKLIVVISFCFQLTSGCLLKIPRPCREETLLLALLTGESCSMHKSGHCPSLMC